MPLKAEPLYKTIETINRWQEELDTCPCSVSPVLGASIIGHPCPRYLWLIFRWALTGNSNGQLLRLFRHDQREEEVFVKDLRAIGVKITHTGLDKDGQYYVDLGCHCGGTIDAIIESGLPDDPMNSYVAEFKTHTHNSFVKLQKEGVKSKLCHYAQLQLNMFAAKIPRAFYLEPV